MYISQPKSPRNNDFELINKDLSHEDLHQLESH